MKAKFKFSGDVVIIHLTKGLIATEGEFLVITDSENCFVMSRDDVEKYFDVEKDITGSNKHSTLSNSKPQKSAKKSRNPLAYTAPHTVSGKIFRLYLAPSGNGKRPKFTRDEILRMTNVPAKFVGRAFQSLRDNGILEYDRETQQFSLTKKGSSALAKYHT